MTKIFSFFLNSRFTEKRAIPMDMPVFLVNSVNEDELIREIANKILNDPNLLDVNHWHNGDSHCIGGWAIVLNKEAQEIEKIYGSEIAACLLLPNIQTFIFYAQGNGNKSIGRNHDLINCINM